jgi:hypothetical protein
MNTDEERRRVTEINAGVRGHLERQGAHTLRGRWTLGEVTRGE